MNEKENYEIEYLVFLATALLVYIAYSESQKANNISSKELLLFITSKWTSIEIIKARQIIHEFFVKNYRDKNGNTKEDYEIALIKTAHDILKLSRFYGNQGSKFLYLLNLLDFLETLGYFNYKLELSEEDIQNTCGHNIIFFYRIFNKFIEQRKKHDPAYYEHFTSLYNKLNIKK